MLRFISNIILVLLPLFAWAQKDGVDTIQYKPTGLRLGTDLISIGRTLGGDKFNGWELNTDIDFHRYYLAIDYGQWSRNVSLSNGEYTNDGSYFRAGIDVNFLLKDPDRNMFFIGFRYGHSDFDQSVVYQVADSIFGDASYAISNTDLTADWGELTVGLRVKIWKAFWMGYTARMKFFPGLANEGEIKTFDIPGYGLGAKRTYYGFNYQVFWRIPFKKRN